MGVLALIELIVIPLCVVIVISIPLILCDPLELDDVPGGK